MGQPPQNMNTNSWSAPETITMAFKEYQLLIENTAKVSDNRQALSSLYISVVNLGFLTGSGYLLLQFFQNDVTLAILAGGLLVISILITAINRTWLRLSDQNRRLLNLRIRYLTELEKHLAQSTVFPPVEIKLKRDEIGNDGKDIFIGRGTYTIEEILYPPNAKRAAFGFSQAEERIGNIFTLTYWLAFIIAAAVWVLTNWALVLQFFRQIGIPA